jgi:hypothetical protein
MCCGDRQTKQDFTPRNRWVGMPLQNLGEQTARTDKVMSVECIAAELERRLVTIGTEKIAADDSAQRLFFLSGAGFGQHGLGLPTALMR